MAQKFQIFNYGIKGLKKDTINDKNIGVLKFVISFYLERCFQFCFQFLRAKRKVFQNSTSLGVFIDFFGENKAKHGPIVYASPSFNCLPISQDWDLVI